MRLKFLVVIGVAIILEFYHATSAPDAENLPQTSSFSMQLRSVGTVTEHLTRRKPTNIDQGEERAIDIKRLWDWTYFTRWNLNRMQGDWNFMRKMFKKWDHYTMEQIKMRIGQKVLNNERLAKMLVSYVQNYRVYKNNPPPINPPLLP